VEAILRQVESGAGTRDVVDDQRGCPTHAPDLAAGILDLLECEARGTVHVVNSGSTTWFGLARAIVERVAPGVVVRPVPSEAYPRPARRPANSVLSTARLQAILGRRLPPWEDALDRYLELRCAS
jgi:dTDP-4-dehydrorhamnose reductase